jgi:hypothetical protein
MSYTSSQILDLIAPQFASNANKADYIALAELSTNACVFGEKYYQAVALRAAHMLEMATRLSGDAGSVASKREGDLAVSYHSGAANLSVDLGQTSYGRQLLGLQRGSIAGFGVTGGNDIGC